MPVLATMGLRKIYVAPASEDGKTMPVKGPAWKDLGDVYQDSCKFKDDDPEITEHKSETSSKVITQVGETPSSIDVTLMDPDLTLLALYFGGEVKGVAKSRTWVRPKKIQYKEFAIWIQPEEGFFVGCANVRIIPKLDITYSAKGICLVPMNIKLQAELQIDESMKDPTVA